MSSINRSGAPSSVKPKSAKMKGSDALRSQGGKSFDRMSKAIDRQKSGKKWWQRGKSD